MQAQTSVFIAEGMVISAALILVAVLVFVFSPMLWTDHWAPPYQTPVPSGCSIQTTMAPSAVVTVAHCPFWVKYPN